MPEIADGVVELRACAREPGQRTKIAVWSNDANIDPVGACVGARGARVRQVVNELRGEKIDIVPFSEDREDFVMKALQPARVREVRIDEQNGQADVIVPDQQLSLAIGKEGQNARLASRLSGLRIDIRSETDMAEQEAYEAAYSEDSWAEGEWVTSAETGEQMWQPADGSPPLTIEEWQSNQAAADLENTEAEVSESLEQDTAAAVADGEEAVRGRGRGRCRGSRGRGRVRRGRGGGDRRGRARRSPHLHPRPGPPHLKPRLTNPPRADSAPRWCTSGGAPWGRRFETNIDP